MSGVAEILERAADLIAKPGAWVKGAYALDHEGNDTDSPLYLGEPVCFCAIGALNVAAGKRPDTTDNDILGVFGRLVGDESIHGWNDAPGRTQAEVVSALRQAAEAVRQDDGGRS